jgi:hypothetical protein
MISIRDEIPTRRVPVVNYLLITINVLVFGLMWLAGSAQVSPHLAMLTFRLGGQAYGSPGV